MNSCSEAVHCLILDLKRKNGKCVAQSDLEKAEEFNGQFTDVFHKNEHTQVPRFRDVSPPNHFPPSRFAPKTFPPWSFPP